MGRNGEEPLSPLTIASYKNTVKRYIAPYFGSEKLTSIDAARIELYISQMLSLRSSPNLNLGRSRARAGLLLVKIAMNHAYKFDVIATNPAKNFRIAKLRAEEYQKKRARVPTKEEFEKVHACAKTCRDSTNLTVRRAYERYWPLYLVLSMTGMRIGEALGLQWGDINGDFTTIDIQRTIIPNIPGIEEAERVRPPKSANGYRQIPIPDKLSDALKEWKVTSTNRRLGTNWVFSTKHGDLLSYTNVARKFWIPLLERAGVRRFGMHGLRHYYASTLINKGHIYAASAVLGHSTASFTLDQYGHVENGGETHAEVRKIINEI